MKPHDFPVGSFVMFRQGGQLDPHAIGTIVGLSKLPDRVWVYWGIEFPLLELTRNLVRCGQVQHEDRGDWQDNQ